MTSPSPPSRSSALARRAADELRDPWVLLLAGLGGGLAWAIGIPALVALLIAVAMLAGAGTLGAVRNAGAPELEGPKLRSGTQQRQLVDALEGYLGDLRAMRHTKLPDAVTDSTIEALVAADGARQVGHRVAAAIDALDAALDRTTSVTRTAGGNSAAIRASLSRMTARRDALLSKLAAAVGEVAEVYTSLLELSATVDTLNLGDGVSDVEAVNTSLDALRVAFAALEKDASTVRELT